MSSTCCTWTNRGIRIKSDDLEASFLVFPLSTAATDGPKMSSALLTSSFITLQFMTSSQPPPASCTTHFLCGLCTLRRRHIWVRCDPFDLIRLYIQFISRKVRTSLDTVGVCLSTIPWLCQYIDFVDYFQQLMNPIPFCFKRCRSMNDAHVGEGVEENIQQLKKEERENNKCSEKRRC